MDLLGLAFLHINTVLFLGWILAPSALAAPPNRDCKARCHGKPEGMGALPHCPPPKMSTLSVPVGLSSRDCPITSVPMDCPTPARHQEEFTRGCTKGQTLLHRAHALSNKTHSAGQTQDSPGDQAGWHRAPPAAFPLFLGRIFFLSLRIRSISPKAHPAQEGRIH